ncbi:MAG TPA: S-layer homology domain-containing protein [Coleofasciculaceae cyanobacterium]
MTNPPPVEPRPSRNRDLGFDDAIAMLIAFGTIGAVLWWGLSQKGADLAQGVQVTPSAGASSVFEGLTVPEGEASQASGITSAADQPAGQPGQSPQVPSSGLVPAPSNPTAVAPVVVAPAVVPGRIPASSAAIDPPPELVVPAAQATPVEFSDVAADYWARPFIAALAQRGIVTGFSDGTFKPDEPVSRSQYAALIETIFQTDTAQNPIAFNDIPENFWATPAINTAVKTGFMKGFPEGTFQPDQPISRVQVLASLVNGLKVAQPASPTEVVKLYQDSAQIPTWAVPAAASATQTGMVVNYPARGVLNPNQPITRAEISAVVHQALVAAGKLDPIPSDYIVRP